MNIVFVHLGKSEIPGYLIDNLKQTLRSQSECVIHCVTSADNLKKLKRAVPSAGHIDERLKIYSVDSLPNSHLTLEYRRRSQLDRGFRDGFWFHASERFLVLHDFMRAFELKNILHLESDVVLYTNFSNFCDRFSSYARLAVPLDRDRAIPGVVWFADSEILGALAESMLNLSNIDDMRAVGLFCAANSHVAKPLPTMPENYARDNRLSLERYCQALDQFGGIFDAAAIGQYLGGVDPRNRTGSSRFFINENSDLCLNDLEFTWEYREGRRLPMLRYKDQWTPVHALHIHSKCVSQFSPFAHTIPQREEQVITGERIQALARVTVSRSDVTLFHGRQRIKTPLVYELLSDPQVEIPIQPPSEVLSAKTYFVYTHLLGDFRQQLLPWITHHFVLMTGNSDHEITSEYLDLLNDNRLVAWYAQNIRIAHPRLRALPIGLENSQWWPEGPRAVVECGLAIRKINLCYLNFALGTHPVRQWAFEIASKLKSVTIDENQPKPQYLNRLARHKFSLCPRGNGIDTHRFWESTYVSTIPIIIKDDWCQSFASLPVLVLDDYDSLRDIDLQREYIRITTSYSETRGHLMPQLDSERVV